MSIVKFDKKIISIVDSVEPLPFDSLVIGLIDFKNFNHEIIFQKGEYEIYDLASLTKPLTCSIVKLIYPEVFTEKMNLLLDHRGGLHSWARLSKRDWKNYLEEKNVKESNTLYSDLSYLKLKLEIEKDKGPIQEILQSEYGTNISYWKDLSDTSLCAPTGFRNKEMIQGKVHDDNAFIINEFTTHAGLFSSCSGLCNFLIHIEKKFNLLKLMENLLKEKKDRFVQGWDTPSLPDSLAGIGFSKSTFGHLGFTGTSIWIDAEKKVGQIILSNCTQNFWQEREGLNQIRKQVGTYLWSQ